LRNVFSLGENFNISKDNIISVGDTKVNTACGWKLLINCKAFGESSFKERAIGCGGYIISMNIHPSGGEGEESHAYSLRV
jgi:hypothetical protein